jgi:hypothetical protein
MIVALWRRGLQVLSPPATEEIGANGREIESRRRTGFLRRKIKTVYLSIIDIYHRYIYHIYMTIYNRYLW